MLCSRSLLHMAVHGVPLLQDQQLHRQHSHHMPASSSDCHGMQAVKLLCLLRQGPDAVAMWRAAQAEADKAGEKLLVLEMRRQMAHLWAQQGDAGQALPALQQVRL